MRNAFHVLIGFSIMYVIGSLTNFAGFDTYSMIVGVPLISLIVGLVIGFFWEWKQSLQNPKNFDNNDIFRTALGTLSGGLFSLWLPDINWLMITLSITSAVLILKDLIKKK
jgi:hypothetical protein